MSGEGPDEAGAWAGACPMAAQRAPVVSKNDAKTKGFRIVVTSLSLAILSCNDVKKVLQVNSS
jgi:hypothetical protein